MPKTERFTFDAEEAREFQPAYNAVRAELDAAGKYPYNSEFEGRIPGLAGEADEERGIYLLQKLHKLDAERAKLAAFLADGGFPVEDHDPAKPFRGTVVEMGFYVGGTGWREHKDVRLVYRNSRPFAVLRPRARTRGHMLTGTVYLKYEA